MPLPRLVLVLLLTSGFATWAAADPPPIAPVGKVLKFKNHVEPWFSASGKYLVAGSAVIDVDKQVLVGGRGKDKSDSPFPARLWALTADEREAYVFRDRSVERWGIPSAAKIAGVPADQPLGFSKDAKVCLTADGLINPRTGAKAGPRMALPPGDPRLLSPDGRTAIVVQNRSVVQRWETAMGKQLRPDLRLPESENINQVGFNVAGNVLIVGDTGGQVSRLFDVKTGAALSGVLKGYAAVVAVSPDGDLFAAAGDAGESVLVKAVKTEKEVATLVLTKEELGVRQVAFSPDGKRLVTLTSLAKRDDTGARGKGLCRITVWSAATGEVLARSDPKNYSTLLGPVVVVMSPTGKQFLTSGGGEVILWSMPAQ